MKIVVIGGTGLISDPNLSPGFASTATTRWRRHRTPASTPSRENGIVEVAGPERLRLDELIRQSLRAQAIRAKSSAIHARGTSAQS